MCQDSGRGTHGQCAKMLVLGTCAPRCSQGARTVQSGAGTAVTPGYTRYTNTVHQVHLDTPGPGGSTPSGGWLHWSAASRVTVTKRFHCDSCPAGGAPPRHLGCHLVSNPWCTQVYLVYRVCHSWCTWCISVLSWCTWCTRTVRSHAPLERCTRGGLHGAALPPSARSSCTVHQTQHLHALTVAQATQMPPKCYRLFWLAVTVWP